MPRHKLIFLACSITAAVALLLGSALLAMFGLSLPPWLMAVGLASCFALALLTSFTAVLPSLVPWLKLKEIQGALLVVVAVAAIWLPPQFVFAGVFLGLGVRQVWRRACELARPEQPPVPDATGTELMRSTSDVVPATLERANGSIIRRAGQR